MLLDSLLRDLVPLALHWLARCWHQVRSLVWSAQPDKEDRLEPVQRPPPSAADVRWAEARLEDLLSGSHTEPGDAGHTAPPDWLEPERIRRANQLHRLHWPAINNAQVMALFLSFTFPEAVRPLLWTGRSHTPRLARRRYLQTALFTLSWALGDVWHKDDAAYHNAERVRTMHAAVVHRLQGRDLSQLQVPETAPPPNESSRLPAIQADLAAADKTTYNSSSSSGCPAGFGAGACPLSQRGMADTQWFFVGLLLLHPDKFGLGHLSEDDLACFLHLWRSIGHRLGVSDRYNLCAGSVSQVRELCRLMEQRVLVPQLRVADPLWHVMTQALYDGLGTAFVVTRYDSWLCYLVRDVLGLPAKQLYSTLTWAGRLKLLLLRLAYRRANVSRRAQALIRAWAKQEFHQAAVQEKLEPHLTYVFELM